MADFPYTSNQDPLFQAYICKLIRTLTQRSLIDIDCSNDTLDQLSRRSAAERIYSLTAIKRRRDTKVRPKTGMSVYNNVHTFLQSNKTPLMKSSSPNIFYTKLPEHHRSNKSLPSPFTVLITSPVPDGTIVTVAAGNDETPSGEVRHDTAKVIGQVARFSDLRFVGKSGRGKNFHLTICVHTKPMMVAMVARAIKVTVDGPREARTPNAALTHRRRPCATFASPVPPFFPTYPPLLWFTTPDFRTIPALLTRPAPNDTSPEGGRNVCQPVSQEPPRKRARKQSSSNSPTSSPPVWRPCPFD